MLALVPLLLAAQPDVPREASSYEQIGQVIATARVCDAFGYTLDRQGLADWAAVGREALVRNDPALTSDEAQLQIERHVISSFVRDYRMYWEQASRDGGAADGSMATEYRYLHLQGKTCERLARSQAVGQFLTPPEQEPEAHEIVRRVRNEYRRIRQVL
jgi:hypothetical protein